MNVFDLAGERKLNCRVLRALTNAGFVESFLSLHHSKRELMLYQFFYSGNTKLRVIVSSSQKENKDCVKLGLNLLIWLQYGHFCQ